MLLVLLVHVVLIANVVFAVPYVCSFLRFFDCISDRHVEASQDVVCFCFYTSSRGQVNVECVVLFEVRLGSL